MRLGKNQIERIATMILKKVGEVGGIHLQEKNQSVRDEIAHCIVKNFEEEDAIDEAAQKLLAQHRKEFGMGLDEEKALFMIKRQLAKEKNFIL
jgi:hypothetical protein